MDQILSLLGNAEGLLAGGAAAGFLEVVLRLVKTKSPYSLLLVISKIFDSLGVALKEIAKTAKALKVLVPAATALGLVGLIFVKISDVVDLIIPQRLKD